MRSYVRRAGFIPLERRTYKTTLGIRRNKLPSSLAGFTLVEILVVVAVIGILASVMTLSFGDIRSQDRDAQRQTDLRAAQTAIENYKRREGSYPDPGCVNNGWSSESNCSIYIVDLAPKYMQRLPTDPSTSELSGSTSGFSYRTNSDRSVYKLMVRGMVESEEVTPSHELAPCSSSPGWCSSCNEDSNIYKTSYAVWGGFAADKSDTENIICHLDPS